MRDEGSPGRPVGKCLLHHPAEPPAERAVDEEVSAGVYHHQHLADGIQTQGPGGKPNTRIPL